MPDLSALLTQHVLADAAFFGNEPNITVTLHRFQPRYVIAGFLCILFPSVRRCEIVLFRHVFQPEGWSGYRRILEKQKRFRAVRPDVFIRVLALRYPDDPGFDSVLLQHINAP